MGDSYTYETLSSPHHIRVLTLAPSEDASAVLQCSLNQQDIDDPENEYEAISYTWGDQERTHPLMCDGTTITITPNLASALLRFRSQTKPRRLWADAVCINQEDLEEKGQQISLMARIFRSASLVRVWLGNGDEGESKALADIAYLVKRISPNAMQYQDTESETFQALERLRSPLRKIFSMPWFGRRWIVQELVLNGNVMFHCGMSKIPWSSLHFAFHSLSDSPWVNDLGSRTQRTIRQFGSLWRTWCFSHAFTTERGIYNLLRSFEDLECKEPKDKLYAIAGLADDVELLPKSSTGPCRVSSVITPTYGPTVSMDEVLQDLAFKVIRFGKVLDTLEMAGASRITEGERPLPSWVPDVRQSGPWPMVYGRHDDFTLLRVCEPPSDTLTLEIEVYGSGSDRASPGELDVVQEECPSLRPESCSMFDWHVLSVGDIYKTPDNWFPKGIPDLHHDIIDWLNLRIPNGRSNSHIDVEFMLFYLHNSQLLTEDERGHMFFTGFSIEEFQKLYQESNNEDYWSSFLTRALSTWSIFCVEFQQTRNQMVQKDLPKCNYFGFGPHDLNPGDKIFIPSDPDVCGKALFLRPEGTKYKVLGGGLVWQFGRDSSKWSLAPRDIEIRLL